MAISLIYNSIDKVSELIILLEFKFIQKFLHNDCENLFLEYYRHINFDVPKVLKMSPYFQRWWDKFPLIFES